MHPHAAMDEKFQSIPPMHHPLHSEQPSKGFVGAGPAGSSQSFPIQKSRPKGASGAHSCRLLRDSQEQPGDRPGVLANFADLHQMFNTGSLITMPPRHANGRMQTEPRVFFCCPKLSLDKFETHTNFIPAENRLPTSRPVIPKDCNGVPPLRKAALRIGSRRGRQSDSGGKNILSLADATGRGDASPPGQKHAGFMSVSTKFRYTATRRLELVPSAYTRADCR